MNFLSDVAPWLISGTTVASTHLIGMRYRHAYKWAVVNVCIWSAWSISSGNYGFMPLNLMLIIQYLRYDTQQKKE